MSRVPVEDWVQVGPDRFRVRGWPALVPTDVAVIIHHGLGEHGGRYSVFAEQLAGVPAHIWTFDARGHGESDGVRGRVGGLQELTTDFEALLPDLIARSGASRVVVYGHSMGAAAVAWYLTHRSVHEAIAGVWLSAPPTVVTLTAQMRVKAAAARVLNRLMPWLTLASGLPQTGISSVAAEVESYRADPLIHDRISAALAWSLLTDAPTLMESARKITLPALLWHGGADPIADRRGTEGVFAALGSEDRALRIIEGAMHEVHRETAPIAGELFDMLREWLASRVPPPHEGG